MLELFTVEEIYLMCIFDTSSRLSLIDGLSTAASGFVEPELTEIAENALAKLNALNDSEFAALEFYPEYDDDDDYEEV